MDDSTTSPDASSQSIHDALSAAGIEFDSKALAPAAKKTLDADINTLIHLGKTRSLKDMA